MASDGRRLTIEPETQTEEKQRSKPNQEPRSISRSRSDVRTAEKIPMQRPGERKHCLHSLIEGAEEGQTAKRRRGGGKGADETERKSLFERVLEEAGVSQGESSAHFMHYRASGLLVRPGEPPEQGRKGREERGSGVRSRSMDASVAVSLKRRLAATVRSSEMAIEAAQEHQLVCSETAALEQEILRSTEKALLRVKPRVETREVAAFAEPIPKNQSCPWSLSPSSPSSPPPVRVLRFPMSPRHLF